MGAGEPEPGVDDLGGRGDCAGYDCVGGGGDGGSYGVYHGALVGAAAGEHRGLPVPVDGRKADAVGDETVGVTTRDPSAGEVLTVYGTAALRAGVTYLLSGLPSGSITLTSALLSDAGAASPYISSRSLLVEPA